MKPSKSLSGTASGNLAGIPRFEPGAPISATSLNRMAERLNATPSSSADGAWHQSIYGNIVSGGGRRLKAAASSHPFKGRNASSDGMAKTRVVFGIVNNVVPKIMDALTGMLIPMDGTTGTPPRPPELATLTAGKAYLMTLWNGAEPKTLESAEVKFATEVPEDDETHGHQLLFTVALNDAGTGIAAIAQGATSSYNVQRVKCGESVQYFFTGVTS